MHLEGYNLPYRRGLNGFGDLMLGTQAPGAKVKPLWLAVNHDGGWVDVRYPAAVGVVLGVADVMTELW